MTAVVGFLRVLLQAVWSLSSRSGGATSPTPRLRLSAMLVTNLYLLPRCLELQALLASCQVGRSIQMLHRHLRLNWLNPHPALTHVHRSETGNRPPRLYVHPANTSRPQVLSARPSKSPEPTYFDISRPWLWSRSPPPCAS